MEVEGVPSATPFPESALVVTDSRVLTTLLGRWGLIDGRALATRQTPGTGYPGWSWGTQTLVLGALLPGACGRALNACRGRLNSGARSSEFSGHLMHPLGCPALCISTRAAPAATCLAPAETPT